MFRSALIEVAIRWGRFLFPNTRQQHHPTKDNRRQHNLKNKLSFVCHGVLLSCVIFKAFARSENKFIVYPPLQPPNFFW